MAGNPKRGPAVPPGYPPAAQPPPPNQYANPAEQARITSPNTPGKIAPPPPEPRTTGQTPGQAPTGRGSPPQEANPANTPNWNPNLYAGGTKPFPGAPPAPPQQVGPSQAAMDASQAWNQKYGGNPNPFGLTGTSSTTYTKINPATGSTYETSDPNGGPQQGGNQGYANAAGGKQGGQGGGFSSTGAMPQMGRAARIGGGMQGGAQMPGGMQAGANTAGGKQGAPPPPPQPTQAPANTAGGKGPVSSGYQ